MGRFDSSKWRVQPVFDELRKQDKTGGNWLATLLSLPGREGRDQLVLSPDAIGRLEQAAWTSKGDSEPGWNPAERRLPAPAALLNWLVDNVEGPRSTKGWGSDATREKRELLVQRDPKTRDEAHALLRSALKSNSDWHVLEGDSCPDVYLQTSRAIVVIEGKLTEATPTTSTTWLSGRHQMLRHIDAAWDQRNGRDVYGFFIVDNLEAPGWRGSASKTVEPEVLRRSLPHRSAAERKEIAEAFLGITTWRDVCRDTGINPELLQQLPEAR